MKAYAEYTSQLDDLLERSKWGHQLPEKRHELLHNLNGGAAETLRALVPSSELWQSGAFFTPLSLARNALRLGSSDKKNIARRVFDPAFGAGDLLLRWAETLPLGRSLEATLNNWGGLLSGCELHPEFISVAKRRLALLAVHRGAKLMGQQPLQWSSLFPNLVHSDFTVRTQKLAAKTTVLMNPPFTMIPAPVECSWASGGVNAAALFFQRILESSPNGQRIIAILPEVLRSGSRYIKWRQLVADKVTILRCQSWGRFSKHADVDVFIFDGFCGDLGDGKKSWPTSNKRTWGKVLGDISKITVGPVVPHRHAEVGKKVPYIVAKSIPGWRTIRRASHRRCFTGTLTAGPFVAVRRTSSPHDLVRAIGTIVVHDQKIAVENHLLVLKPVSNTLKDCQRILRSLRNPATTLWLNKRIRCRHLTVEALKELPFFEGS